MKVVFLQHPSATNLWRSQPRTCHLSYCIVWIFQLHLIIRLSSCGAEVEFFLPEFEMSLCQARLIQVFFFFFEVGFGFARLFSHSKAVQPKLNWALAGKANLPENHWIWPRAPQAFLVLIRIAESAALDPVIYGAFLHHKFCTIWVWLSLSLHLWTKAVNTIIPPLTSKTDSMTAKHFKDSGKQIKVSPSPSSHFLLPLLSSPALGCCQALFIVSTCLGCCGLVWILGIPNPLQRIRLETPQMLALGSLQKKRRRSPWWDEDVSYGE